MRTGNFVKSVGLPAAIVAVLGLGSLATPAADPMEACGPLAEFELPAADIGLPTGGARVTDAVYVPADASGNTDGAYCRIRGAIRAVAYNAPAIHFQVNLPTAWNGKTLQFGGSGLNGRLVTGLGHYRKQPETEATPLARGYVTYGSDSGHVGSTSFDGRFMLNDEALRNYGHEQIKKTADVALRLTEEYYGRRPDYRYFIGGSQGGHEAFDAAQRYPDDYDGIVAGYPAHNVVMLHLSANRYARALYANDGRSWISPARVRAFTAQVYLVCDSLDGADDGIIANVDACRQATASFKLKTAENPVRCKGGEDGGDHCLSDFQIDALNVMDEPFDLGFSVFADDEGNSIFPKWTPFEGSTFFDGGYPNLGADGPDQALQRMPGDATPRYAIARDLTLDAMRDFDPRRYAGRIAELVEVMSANSTDLERFRGRGGKLIFFHGTVDDYIPVYSSIEYFDRLQRRYGDTALDSFVRFYTIPGMGHVTGPFNARIAMLDYLEAWVESGEAPGELIAIDVNESTAGRTRPVCRYPAWPRYESDGDLDHAASFVCVEP